MSLNTIRAMLILNAKRGPKKGSAKAKGWTDEARKKAALTRKRKAAVGAEGLKKKEVKDTQSGVPVPKTLGFDNRYGKLKDHQKHYQEVLKPLVHQAVSKEFKLGTFSADRKKLRLVPKDGASDTDRVNVYFKGTHPTHGYPMVEASAYKKRTQQEVDRLNAVSHLVGGSFLGSMFAGMPDGEGRGNPNSPTFQPHLQSAIEEARNKMRQ